MSCFNLPIIDPNAASGCLANFLKALTYQNPCTVTGLQTAPNSHMFCPTQRVKRDGVPGTSGTFDINFNIDTVNIDCYVDSVNLKILAVQDFFNLHFICIHLI